MIIISKSLEGFKKWKICRISAKTYEEIKLWGLLTA